MTPLLRQTLVGTLLPKLCDALPLFASCPDAATALLSPVMKTLARVNALLAARAASVPKSALQEAPAPPTWLDHLQVRALEDNG